MIKTNQKEDLLNFLLFFYDRKVKIIFTFENNYRIYLCKTNVMDGILIRLSEISNKTHLYSTFPKIRISDKISANCWDVLQYIVENGLYFTWINQKTPIIRLWNGPNMSYFIEVYDDHYTFNAQHSLEQEKNSKTVNSLNGLTKLIRYWVIEND